MARSLGPDERPEAGAKGSDQLLSTGWVADRLEARRAQECSPVRALGNLGAKAEPRSRGERWGRHAAFAPISRLC